MGRRPTKLHSTLADKTSYGQYDFDKMWDRVLEGCREWEKKKRSREKEKLLRANRYRDRRLSPLTLKDKELIFKRKRKKL